MENEKNAVNAFQVELVIIELVEFEEFRYSLPWRKDCLIMFGRSLIETGVETDKGSFCIVKLII